MFRYTKRQIILHWIVTLLIAAQYLFADGIEHAFEQWMETGQKDMAAGMPHAIPGLLILIFAIWRLSIRRTAPAAPQGDALRDKIAKLTHWGLYALMLLMPISGMAAWMGGIAPAAAMHNLGKLILLALIALHVIGALYHQFVLRDGLLSRMSPH